MEQFRLRTPTWGFVARHPVPPENRSPAWLSAFANIIQFRVAHIRPGASRTAIAIASSRPTSDTTVSGTAHLHGARPTFLERHHRDTQTGSRSRSRENCDGTEYPRRHTGGALHNLREHLLQTFRVHRLRQRVLHHLATRGWSGIRSSPSRFSGHAAASGKTDASRSSARIL